MAVGDLPGLRRARPLAGRSILACRDPRAPADHRDDAVSGQPPAHMRKRADETQRQHRERLARSCYRCGWYSTDAEELDAHEDRCTAGGVA